MANKLKKVYCEHCGNLVSRVKYDEKINESKIYGKTGLTTKCIFCGQFTNLVIPKGESSTENVGECDCLNTTELGDTICCNDKSPLCSEYVNPFNECAVCKHFVAKK